MPGYGTEAIRNVALVGHAGSGKTTLAEALLYHGGDLNVMGSVEKGTAVSDFDPLEQRYHHSVYASVLHLDFKGCHINLIDTPGSPDFVGPTVSALAAVETAVAVINAQAGVEVLSRQLMELAADYRCCRMVVINKIDADQVNLPAVLAAVQEAFGSECLPINLPADGASRVVDCFFTPEGSSDFSSVAELHTALVDQVVEVDDKLMELYLDQGEISADQLHDPFEQALREGHIVPICFTSARTGAGVAELLDILVRLAPNPREGNAHEFVDDDHDGAAQAAVPQAERHLLAHVFKVDFDPFAGKLGVFRVHQGQINRDSQIFVDDNRKPIKVGHLLRVHGKQLCEVEHGIPGDICAIPKVEELHWDSVIHDSHDEDHVHLRLPRFPVPVAGVAIEAKRRGDEQKISDVLAKLSEEDPCLTVERDADARQLVLRGLGDLHLRLALEKMAERYHLEVESHPPEIAYRETINSPAEGHYRHKKQSGGAGQFGEVFLRIEPLERGAGFEFVDDVKGGTVPAQFIPAVEKGVRQAMEEGPLTGHTVQDVRVAVYDGKHHSVDSNEVSFVVAGRRAFQDAFVKARPMVLEPVVELVIETPEARFGDLSGDLSSRRGRITATESQGTGSVSIRAEVPLAELQDYQPRFKSMTGGEGSYALRHSHYEPVPPPVQAQLASRFKKKDDD
jgi:elongation factor G